MFDTFYWGYQLIQKYKEKLAHNLTEEVHKLHEKFLLTLYFPPFLFTTHDHFFLFGNTCHRILLFQFYPWWAYVKILIYLLCNRKFLEVRCPAPLFLVRPLFLVYAIARCRRLQAQGRMP